MPFTVIVWRYKMRTSPSFLYCIRCVNYATVVPQGCPQGGIGGSNFALRDNMQLVFAHRLRTRPALLYPHGGRTQMFAEASLQS